VNTYDETFAFFAEGVKFFSGLPPTLSRLAQNIRPRQLHSGHAGAEKKYHPRLLPCKKSVWMVKNSGSKISTPLQMLLWCPDSGWSDGVEAKPLFDNKCND